MVARQVLATDPRVLQDLATVRLGTAYFRRALLKVRDEDFAAPSLLPAWRRNQLVAHVGYNARAIARLVAWAATGVETPMYASPKARGDEIERGSTLRPDALRSLCEHAAIDLDVRWRDLPDDRWTSTVVTAQGREVPASETLWMRSREVWLHAVDLDVGGRVEDIPTPVLRRLLADVVGAWEKRGELDGLALSVDTTRDQEHPSYGDIVGASTSVSGPLPVLVAWATGRALPDHDELEWLRGTPVEAPRWL
jgi:maleylpyruvate isomerase